MNTLVFGLSVALLGMLVVFGGLVILIICINVISAASKEKKHKQPKQTPAPAASVAQSAAAPAPAPVATDDIPAPVLAAITAAIASVWQGKTGFTVRHVKRVSNAPAWSRAGREEQIYSRM